LRAGLERNPLRLPSDDGDCKLAAIDGEDQLVLLGRGWSLDLHSVILLYLIGVADLILVLTSIYLVMPPPGTHLVCATPWLAASR
jgi:hypothetical protein